MRVEIMLEVDSSPIEAIMPALNKMLAIAGKKDISVSRVTPSTFQSVEYANVVVEIDDSPKTHIRNLIKAIRTVSGSMGWRVGVQFWQGSKLIASVDAFERVITFAKDHKWTTIGRP